MEMKTKKRNYFDKKGMKSYEETCIHICKGFDN